MSALLFAGGVGSLSVSHNAFNSTLLLFVLGFGSLSRGESARRKRQSHDFLPLIWAGTNSCCDGNGG